MKIIQLIEEDFVNYKRPAFYVGFPTCSFKCDTDCGRRVCQNRPLITAKKIEVEFDRLIEKYLGNSITKAIVCGGLEPLDSMQDLKDMILAFRKKTDDDIVVYTGYYEYEPLALEFISFVKEYNVSNILAKFGRYVPDQKNHFDDIIGVWLASDKQHGVKIS